MSKRHLNVTLCGKIIYLVRFDCADDFDQATTVGHVAIVEFHFALFVRFGVGVQVLDPDCIEGARPANDPIHFVPFAEQELSQIRAILLHRDNLILILKRRQ